MNSVFNPIIGPIFAEHQLGQLEKQLITCNVKVSKHEKTITQLREGITQKEEQTTEIEKKWKTALDENRKITEEIVRLKFFFQDYFLSAYWRI